MRFTYNWLKDFVEVKVSPQVLAEKLTMAGLEVTSLEKVEDDWVFEVEVTSNRPDWLSVIGIAREVAAITKSKFKIQNQKSAINPKSQITKSKTKLEIKIENKQDCPLYTAAIIYEVKIAPSPEWMRRRLEAVGMRPVNNIVDITNYVLLETGQPLHAFDLDKLTPELKITVRRARKGEDITTLDGKTQALVEDILVIADNKRPIAVAGVIGGKESEVTEGTRNILLEAAKFSPVLVRRSRQKLGITTESSYRFERDVDLAEVLPASIRAQNLIQQIAKGKPYLFKSQPKTIPSSKTKTISLSYSHIGKILNLKIPPQISKRILENLGFKVKVTKERLSVNVPSFRRDIKQDMDLIEEISRIYGFDLIPKTLPRIIPQVINQRAFNLNMLFREILISQGLNEVITLSFISQDLLNKCSELNTGIELTNPLSKEWEILRPTLLPSLLSCVSYNFKRKQELIQVFEIAHIFKPPHQETTVLGIGLCGRRNWCSQEGRQKEEMGIFHLKGVLEVFLERLGIVDYDFIPQAHNALNKGVSFSLSIKDKKIGFLGQVKQDISDAFDIKNLPIFITEINLDTLQPLINLRRKFLPLPVYPSIVRHISLMVRQEVGVKDIVSTIKTQGQPLLKDTKVIDFYTGKHIPEGFKGLTFSCIYQSGERTLQDEEVNRLHHLVSQSLVERFGAEIRK